LTPCQLSLSQQGVYTKDGHIPTPYKLFLGIT
jgi:hypothetical protein